MDVAVDPELVCDGPLSPELVLVSPPEIVRRARERLCLPVTDATVVAPPSAAARSSFVRRNAGVAAFSLFWLLATVGAQAIAIALRFHA